MKCKYCHEETDDPPVLYGSHAACHDEFQARAAGKRCVFCNVQMDDYSLYHAGCKEYQNYSCR